MSSPLDAVFSQSALLMQASGHVRLFKILSGPLSGTFFKGAMHIEGTIDPDMPLGTDVREKSVLAVIRATAPLLESQTKLMEGVMVGTSFVGEQVWKAVAREDNTTDVEVKYDLTKVLFGLDQ